MYHAAMNSGLHDHPIDSAKVTPVDAGNNYVPGNSGKRLSEKEEFERFALQDRASRRF